jgi:hypothetical protein
MQNYGELSNTAVKALFNAINFLSERLQKENISDYIFGLVVGLLKEGKNNGDEEIITNLLLLLTEMCKIIYDKLEKYISTIFQEVLECLSMGVVVQSCEFFNSIIFFEHRFKTNYIRSHYQSILQRALDKLLNLDLEEEESGLSPIDSIRDVIINVNSLVIEDCLNNLVGFFKENIELGEKNQNAALVILEAIVETASPNSTRDLVSDSFGGLINLVNESKVAIKISSIRVLQRVARHVTEIMYKDRNFMNMQESFKKILTIPSTDSDVIKLKKVICQTYEELAESIVKYDQNTVKFFKSYAEDIVNDIITSVTKDSPMAYIDTVFSTVFPFIKNVFSYEQQNKFFALFFRFIEHVKASYPVNIQKDIIDLVFINLSVILV